jgi:hypothetical protein
MSDSEIVQNTGFRELFCAAIFMHMTKADDRGAVLGRTTYWQMTHFEFVN